MKSWSKILIALLVMPLLLVSCGSQALDDNWKPVRAKVTKSESAVESGLIAEKTPEEKALEKQMIAEGPESNPFLSHIIVRNSVATGEKLRGPLECCALSLFRLMAIVTGADTSYALVKAPDSKRYIIRKGDKIGTMGGIVVKIAKSTLTVRANTYNDAGTVIESSDTLLMLPVTN